MRTLNDLIENSFTVGARRKHPETETVATAGSGCARRHFPNGLGLSSYIKPFLFFSLFVFLCLPCVIFFVCFPFALSCLICLHMSSMQKFNYLHFRSTHSCRATSCQEPDPCGSGLGAQPATRLGLHCPRGDRQSQWLRAVAICGESSNYC